MIKKTDGPTWVQADLSPDRDGATVARDIDQLTAALAEALFTSHLSARRDHTQAEVAAAITDAIRTRGIRGCAGEVAAAYGEHPETAAPRMRWARAVIGGHPSTLGGSSASAARDLTYASPVASSAPRIVTMVRQGQVAQLLASLPPARRGEARVITLDDHETERPVGADGLPADGVTGPRSQFPQGRTRISADVPAGGHQARWTSSHRWAARLTCGAAMVRLAPRSPGRQSCRRSSPG